MQNPQHFWDARYSKSTYAYGTQPNRWLELCLQKIPAKGQMLLPAEGEGRNSVYASKLGWQCTAVDFSEAAKTKALQLAEREKVQLKAYELGDLQHYDFGLHTFDAVTLCYVHVPEEWRALFHQKMVDCIKPGGHLILEAFAKEQLGRNSGGPKNEAQLFDLNNLKEDFSTLELLHAQKEEVQLKEGNGHRGLAFVNRIFAKKHE